MFFFFSTTSGPALGPTQPPIQWAPGAISPGVQLPGREANHSPPFPHISSWHSAYTEATARCPTDGGDEATRSPLLLYSAHHLPLKSTRPKRMSLSQVITTRMARWLDRAKGKMLEGEV
jgi:hypothetical protein